jgi:hypothetical protein
MIALLIYIGTLVVSLSRSLNGSKALFALLDDAQLLPTRAYFEPVAIQVFTGAPIPT